MPLYMDIHNLPEGTTPEDVAKAHAKDMETQRKYGVEYSKYWVNESGRKVFCLVHAPNAEAAECVHREAHGMMAEKLIEIQPELAEGFLGGVETNAAGAVVLSGGSADARDSGIRTVLFTDVVNSTTLTQSLGDEAALERPQLGLAAEKRVGERLRAGRGQRIEPDLRRVAGRRPVAAMLGSGADEHEDPRLGVGRSSTPAMALWPRSYPQPAPSAAQSRFSANWTSMQKRTQGARSRSESAPQPANLSSNTTISLEQQFNWPLVSALMRSRNKFWYRMRLLSYASAKDFYSKISAK